MAWWKFLFVALVFVGLVRVSVCVVCSVEPKVVDAYTPKGRMVKVGALDVYETMEGALKGKRTVICAYDVLGMTNNVKQVADAVAAMGDFRIAIPNFFKVASPFSKTSPPTDAALKTFLDANGDWAKVKTDLEAVMAHYKADGVQEFGMLGLGWGGFIAVQASKVMMEIKGCAIVHPTQVTDADGIAVKAPFFVMPSKDEPDMTKFHENNDVEFPGSAGHHKFTSAHGFAGGLGNFNDPVVSKEVSQVISISGAYLDALIK